MMYCTDDRSSPLHTLIADVIDSQGGSQLLIQVFLLLATHLQDLFSTK